MISTRITDAIGVHSFRRMSSAPQLEGQKYFTATMQMIARAIHIQLTVINTEVSI